MSDPRDAYAGEGGDGSDPQLPDSIPEPDPEPEPNDEPEGPDEESEDG